MKINWAQFKIKKSIWSYYLFLTQHWSRMFPLCHEWTALTNWHFWSFCLPSRNPTPPPPPPAHGRLPTRKLFPAQSLEDFPGSTVRPRALGVFPRLALVLSCAPFHIHPPPAYQSKLQLISPIPNLTWHLIPECENLWAAKPRHVWNTTVDLRKQMVSKDRVIYANSVTSFLLSVKLKEALIELPNRSLKLIQEYSGYFSI